MKPKIMIIGAGASGRGHLGQLLFEEGIENLIFVDKNRHLVDQLNLNHGYEVRLLKPGESSERTCEVSGIKAIYRYDKETVIEQFLGCDIILTCVIAENLPDVSEIVAESISAKCLANDRKPINIICCENLDHASSYLKGLVEKQLNKEETLFCKQFVSFPDAMISRVVPIPAQNSLHIVAEEYNEWTVSRQDVIGSSLGASSIELVDNLSARLERKLWIHNGGHAALAYAANLKQIRYIHEALADTETAAFAVEVLNELGNCIIHKYGFAETDVRDYQADLGRRGAIAEMKDEIRRVIRNPMRKLGRKDRLVAPLCYAYQNNLPFSYLIKAIANATLYESPDDAESKEMAQIIQTKGFSFFVNEYMGLGELPALAQILVEQRKVIDNSVKNNQIQDGKGRL